tara:strand:+ start:1053 stop:1829 length:777 start_codon:yes stop_codon:yes gene_type:complete
MSLTNKNIYSTYKDVITINNSNNGFDANIDQLKSGNGNGSALYLSKDNSKIQPTTDSTTTHTVYDKDGNLLFSIDSTNDMIKAGINQTHVNTQYADFGIDGKDSFAFTTNHTAVPYHVGQVQVPHPMGSGTNPDTSLTISDSGDDLVSSIWYIPDAIVIDAVHVWIGADTATGDVVRFHLMSYDIDTSNNSTSGDLSSGVVLADGSDITTLGYEQSYYQSMTIQSSAVASGKAIMFLFKSDTTNSDYSIKATIKYHIK